MSRKNLKKNNLKPKAPQRAWDEGFWKGSIPSYKSSLDPHCEFIKLQINDALNSLTRSQSVPVAPTGSSDSDKLKTELESLWEDKGIPEPQRVVYRLMVFELPRNKALHALKRELNDLRAHKSPTQIALRAVAAREEGLRSLIDMNGYLAQSPDWDSIEEIKTECCELLSAHRILTLNAAESIVKWREQFAIDENRINFLPFLWEGVNYLVKMQRDADFLAVSDFSKVFRFANSQDPLLIALSQAKENGK